MAWRRPGDKPLSEPRMENLLTHICVTRPQWVNTLQMEWNGSCFAYIIIGLSNAGIILQLRPANERWRHTVTPSLIGQAAHHYLNWWWPNSSSFNVWLTRPCEHTYIGKHHLSSTPCRIMYKTISFYIWKKNHLSLTPCRKMYKTVSFFEADLSSVIPSRSHLSGISTNSKCKKFPTWYTLPCMRLFSVFYTVQASSGTCFTSFCEC